MIIESIRDIIFEQLVSPHWIREKGDYCGYPTLYLDNKYSNRNVYIICWPEWIEIIGRGQYDRTRKLVEYCDPNPVQATCDKVLELGGQFGWIG